jgi:hypothetical protein
MPTQRIFGSRTQQSASTYIGNPGLLFYDEVDGELRLSNGVTPGGVAISVRADLIVAQRLTPAEDNDDAYGLGDETHRWWDAHIGDGGIKFNGYTNRPQTVPYTPGLQVDDIIPALDNDINLGSTGTRFANLFLGYDGLFLADQTTDENINITVDQGTLFIDGAQNLRLGNLVIEDTTLKSLTTDLDISIGETNDTGFFYVKRKAQFDNTSFSGTEPMVSFNAGGGAEPATVFPDTILQTVSRPNKNSRIVQRSYGSSSETGGQNSYSVWASYSARGTVAAPAALKANDILARVSANGFGTTTWGSGGARIEFVALENFTDSAKGTRINFWTTPAGQVASQNVASINSVGVIAAGIEFSGDSTVQTTAGIPLTAKAISSATYVATLGVDGKLDASQIPSALTGAIVFKGTWNAATNTPALSDTTPAGLQSGWEYIVETAGTRDIGDGSKTFLAGDFVIYDGTHWKQVPSGNAFISLTGGGGITVNQSTGAMVLGSSATPLSTTATIVSRDSSGNFAANMITANLTGVVTGSVSGNAGSVTNGVYTTGNQSIDGNKTFTSTIQGTATNATLAAAVVGGIGVATLAGSSGTSVSGSTGAVTVWFNTGTLVANAVTAGTVTTAAQPAITSVGTLTSLTVTNLVTAKNYSGQARDAGTLGAAGTLTIDFATDHNVLINLTTTAVIAFSNITAGKTVTVLVKNATGANRAVTLGVVDGNCSNGDAIPTVNNGRTGVFVYRTFGTATTDIYCEVNP